MVRKWALRDGRAGGGRESRETVRPVEDGSARVIRGEGVRDRLTVGSRGKSARFTLLRVSICRHYGTTLVDGRSASRRNSKQQTACDRLAAQAKGPSTDTSFLSLREFVSRQLSPIKQRDRREGGRDGGGWLLFQIQGDVSNGKCVNKTCQGHSPGLNFHSCNYLALLIGGFTQAAPSAVQSPNPSITLSGCGQSPSPTVPTSAIWAARPYCISTGETSRQRPWSSRLSPSTATGHALPTTSCQDQAERQSQFTIRQRNSQEPFTTLLFSWTVF
ncbi:hypothetical protein PO909_007946 [Leuciscus waleckii]